MFGKMFGKKAAAARQELKKIENRDLMQAIVGGCLLVAAADGTIDQAELDKLDKLLRSNANLSHFGSEINQTIDRFKEQLEAGFRVGKNKILEEIQDVKNNQQEAVEVYVNMITLAEADGEMSPAEKKVLEDVGRVLGLRLEEYL